MNHSSPFPNEVIPVIDCKPFLTPFLLAKLG